MSYILDELEPSEKPAVLEPIEAVCKKDCYLDVDAYDRMINKFFETEYGKYSGHTTDYRMPYFMQDPVLENLLYQAGRHFDV